MCKTIEYLRTLPENSGQKVEMTMNQGNVVQFFFMWFCDDGRNLDLKLVDNVNIVSIPRKYWDKIRLV